MSGTAHHLPDAREFRRLLSATLGPERRYYRLILIYSIAISLLTLAIPISVQMLIDTIANIGLFRAVATIGIMLFVLLLVSGALYALRAYAMELSNRSLYSRVTSEIALTSLLAWPDWFAQAREEALSNRYFDIMTVKKNVPYLLSHGFSLFFQSVIGFVVVSLYHFYFFVFSICLILVLWLVWLATGWRAIESGFVLSEAKHATGAWLQRLANGNAFFQARPRFAYALAQSDTLINAHLDAQERHFGYSFGQLLLLLLIYAVASAVLLGMGGWLVIRGELTLGQLVAAELIMSAILYGLPQLAGYLDYYYDVCAAVEELSRLQGVEAAPVSTRSTNVAVPSSGALVMRGARGTAGHEEFCFTVAIPAGSRVRALAASGLVQEQFVRLLEGTARPASGVLTIGGLAPADWNAEDLRQCVLLPARQPLPPLAIEAYLALAQADGSAGRVGEALALFDLGEELRQLPQGLATVLGPTGLPLRLDQVLRLKLAFVLLSDARLVVLDQLFDSLPAPYLERFLAACATERERTVICFTSRTDAGGYDHRLELGATLQMLTAL